MLLLGILEEDLSVGITGGNDPDHIRIFSSEVGS